MMRAFMKRDVFHGITVALLSVIAAGQVAFIVRYYPYTAFLNVDPAAPYVGNALEILLEMRTAYHQDPGVACYLYLAAALFPLKLFTWLSHADLVELVYLHIEPVITYLQLVTLAGALTGLYIASRAAVRLTKTAWIGPLSVLIFLTLHRGHFKWIAVVNTEGFLILIAGLSLSVFSAYVMNKEKRRLLYWAFFLSGVGFATKATALPLTIFFLFFLLYDSFKRRMPAEECFIGAVKGLLSAALGFAVPAILTRLSLFRFLTFLFRVATTTRGAYQQTPASFSSAIFFEKINYILHGQGLALFIGELFILYLFYTLMRREKNLLGRENVQIALIAAASFVSYLLLSAEDLRVRYLIVAFMLESFALCLIIPLFFLKRRLRFVKLIVIIIFFAGACNAYLISRASKLEKINKQYAVEALLKKGNIDSARDRIVYSYCLPTKEFFFMRGNAFTHRVYDTVIGKYQPNFYRYRKGVIHTGYNRAYDGPWDYAIIVNRVRDVFAKRHPSELIAEEGGISLFRSVSKR
jgi:hypothetical protein